MRLTRWIVRKSNYPFTTPGVLLGLVEATSREQALQLSVRFGPAIIVEPETGNTERLEKALERMERAAKRRHSRGHGFARRSAMERGK